MLEYLETLFSLQKHKTMGRAGRELKISQSAVSKRISNLESIVKQKLIEKHGRHVILTPYGKKLVEKVAPIILEIKSILQEAPSFCTHSKVYMGMNESLFVTWGAELIRGLQEHLVNLKIDSVVLSSESMISQVQSGALTLGLCTSFENLSLSHELEAVQLMQEPMVIVPSGLTPLEFTPEKGLSILTASYQGPGQKVMEKLLVYNHMNCIQRCDSYLGALVAAMKGIGHALVPLSILEALNVSKENIVYLDSFGLNRYIYLVGKRSTLTRSVIEEMCTNIQNFVAEISR